MKNIKVSIIIPTRNPGKLFKTMLDNLFSQKFKDFEVIVIDSESTDGTPDMVNKYPAKLISIKTSEFGHGKTRNYGASLASGEFVVFLTQDSIPQTDEWLNNLILPFEDKTIAGVYGRQIPRENENILDKYFALSLYGNANKLWTNSNCSSGDNVFSDANSAVRKKLLLEYPYKNNIIVSEDYEWAFRIMSKGYKIFYSTKASVIHSHSYNLLSLFKRNFDVGVSYKDVYITQQTKNFFSKGIKIYKSEISNLVKTRNIHLIPLCTLRDVIRFGAVQIGKNEHFIPKNIKKKYLSAQSWYWK